MSKEAHPTPIPHVPAPGLPPAPLYQQPEGPCASPGLVGPQLTAYLYLSLVLRAMGPAEPSTHG